MCVCKFKDVYICVSIDIREQRKRLSFCSSLASSMKEQYMLTAKGLAYGILSWLQIPKKIWTTILVLLLMVSVIIWSCLLTFSCLLALSEATTTPKLNRNSFPDGFVFGAGSAAYQTEGAAFIDGRGPSIWDTFTREQPGKITDRSNGYVANDFYHRYKEDIKLMKKIGLDSFRFSFSWSRILPKGKLNGGVNPLGVKFYNDLINELLDNGIKPLVTLWHFDTPQALEDEYDSWLSPKIVKDYLDYVDFCFKTFGDRIKLWVTMNEPNGYCMLAYDSGVYAPGRCSSYVGNCSAGNSATEPYIAAHHFLLSHAAAVKLYRQKYQPYQKGKIGITIITSWYDPKFNTEACRNAASRSLDFYFGWFLEPVIFGDYPQSMRSIVGSRLPKFSEKQKKQLKGSVDFVGANYYTGLYAESAPPSSNPNKSYSTDSQATTTGYKNGIPIGTPTVLSWLFIYPKGFRMLLLYMKKKYNNPIIYITENGVADANNNSLPIKEALKDNMRIKYFQDHLSYLLKSIKEGVNVKGYYIWTFWDDFEWSAGYTSRFGITYIDYNNNLKRYLKYSAYWLKKFLEPAKKS